MRERFRGRLPGQSASERREPEDRSLWATERLVVEGVPVRIIGLRHVPETFAERREEITKTVDEASAVVLEGAPRLEGVFLEQNASALAKLESSSGFIVTDDMVLSILAQNRALQFFADVERVVLLARKPVALLDPLRYRPEWYALLEKERNHEAHLRRLFDATFVGGALAAGLSRLARVSLSRRRLLQGAAAAALGAAAGLEPRLAARAIEAEREERDDPIDVGRVDNPLGRFLRSSRDYRDVVIAARIRQLAKKNRLVDARGIAAIYGRAHLSAISHYLRAPQEVEVRLAEYANRYESIPAAPVVAIPSPDAHERVGTRETQEMSEMDFISTMQKEGALWESQPFAT